MVNKKVIFLAPIFTLLFLNPAYSDSSNSPEKKRAIDAFKYLINNQGYTQDELQFGGFSEKYNGAPTILLSQEDNQVKAFIAEIGIDGVQPEVIFRTYGECSYSDDLEDSILQVNGVSVHSRYMCESNEGELSQRVYVMDSDLGRNYLYKEFSQKDWVSVKFDGLEIPFSTEGFNRLWEINKNKITNN